MPKPYHTPKSDRDEEIGALTEAEEIAEAIESDPLPAWQMDRADRDALQASFAQERADRRDRG